MNIKIFYILSAFLFFSFYTHAQNLLSNPGFENGLSNWESGAWGDAAASFNVVSDVKEEGEKSVKVDVTAAYPDDAGRAYLRKNGLQIEKNVPHKLEFHVLSNSGNMEALVISMYSHTNIGGASWGSAYQNTDITFQGDGKWHKITLNFTPTNVEGEPDFNALGLLFGFAKNKTTIYMDSVSLVSESGVSASNYHVSLNGNNSNDGSLELPFRTIAKAAGLVKAGDTVFIHEGTYEETLVPAKSGLPGFPIVFQAYNSEKVIITAMQALNNWQADDGNIYKTTVDWTLGQGNFVMNESTALDLARWPNNVDSDPFTPNSKRNTGGSNGDVITNAWLTHSEIPNFDWGNGGSLWFYGDRGGAGWTAWKAFIKSSSSGKVTFDLEKNPTWIRTVHPPADKGDYFLEGIKEALDYQNEWYFDEGANVLYVQLPGGVSPQDGKVQMRKRNLTIDLSGRSNIKILNLAVFGGSIEIDGSNNVLSGVSSFYGNVSRGVVTSFRANAQSINVKGSGNRIEQCEVGFGSGSGIWDSGSETKILDCYIHDFNFLGFYDAPVNARGESTSIENNTITRGGRDALQIPSKNSTVAYNDISYSNLIADDCGLLYTLGANRNMKIHHNWFHDAESRGDLKKAAGIYLDNDAGDIEVHHNVVWNTEWTNIQINWNGTKLDIFNNTLWNGSAVMGAWHMDGTAFSNVRVWNNLSDDSNWEEQADKKNNRVAVVNPFSDSNSGDFTLKANSSPIDQGMVIEHITEGYFGTAPDVGAYEFGGENWKTGITWDKNMGAAGFGSYGLPGESSTGFPTAVDAIKTNDVKVYPNPVTGDYLNISFESRSEEISWKIFSINGAIVSVGKSGIYGNTKIEVSNLNSGIYILNITTGAGSFNQKIVKK